MPTGVRPLDWSHDGRTWPNRQFSRFVTAAGLRWHVQLLGDGPPVLLIHGAGATTHSWRDLAPRLARRFRVIAPDLPGHGFSAPLPPDGRPTLPAIAELLAALLPALGHGPAGRPPALLVGHSAGGAIALQLIRTGHLTPRAMIGLAPALRPVPEPIATLLTTLAGVLGSDPNAPELIAAAFGDVATVRRALRDIGSALDPAGVALYARVFRSPPHIAGVLTMFAGWDLAPLAAALPRLTVPALLLAGARDRAIPPADVAWAAVRLGTARSITLPAVGHLLHEERPAEIAARVIALADALLTPRRPTGAAPS